MSNLSITVTPLGITSQKAADAYGKVESGALGGSGDTGGFGAVLSRAVDGVVEAGHKADSQAAQAIAGGGNLTDVVMAVSQAELALQTTVAIRDRVVQAYQDIMRMPI